MKQGDGSSDYSGSVLANHLPPEDYHLLQKIRKELARLLGKPFGPDLDGAPANQPLNYLPAYQRYQGRVYERGQVQALYPNSQNKRIVIISALYGLLDASDPIRNYDLAMDKRYPGTGLLSNWWRKQNLGALVAQYILTLQPTRIHDLLSSNYRKSLGLDCRQTIQAAGIEWIEYQYPNEGSGSMWHRGEDLKRLLSGQQVIPNAKPKLPLNADHIHEPATNTTAHPNSLANKNTYLHPVKEQGMNQADQIRAHVLRTYILPARTKGEKQVRVRASDVARALKLTNRMPAICGALDAEKFLDEAHLSLEQRLGPKQGVTAEWVFGL